MIRSGRGSDQGSASIWLLGVGLAVTVFAGAVAMAGGAAVARHRAQAAADLGALAGAVHAADGVEAACAVAAEIVRANGARPAGCAVAGLDVTITVEVDAPGGWGTAKGVARAGPVRVSGT